MANQTVTGKYLPHVLSESALVYQEAIVGSSASATDTVTVNPPDNVDFTTTPVYAVAYQPQSSPPDLYQALTLTSFNPTTGVLVVTVPSGGSLAAGNKILLMSFVNV